MQPQNAWTDPSVDGPKLQFNNGQVSGISEVMNPVLPNIPGPVSTGWHITQWNPGSWFDPADTIIAPPVSDPVLGQAIYGWQANGSSVDVFGTPGHDTYALTSGGGSLRDLNLEADTMPAATYTFDQQVTFTADERIAAASNFSPLDGASAANCFTVAFNRQDAPDYDPNLPTISFFLQVELGVAGAAPKAFATYGTSEGNIYNVVPGAEGNDYLPGNPDGGALHAVSINLSGAVAQMTRWLATVDGSLGSAVLDLSKWSLTGAYIGIESSGDTSMTLDVAHPIVTRDDGQAATVGGQLVAIAGGVDAADPILVDAAGITATPSRTGPLGTGDTITFTVAGTSALSQSGGTETLLLSDGGAATYTGTDANGNLLFTDTVQAGQTAADLEVTALALNGSTVGDHAGATLDLTTIPTATGANTGLVIRATEPSFSNGVATLPGTGAAVHVTNNAYLAAHPTMLQGMVPDYALAGLNTLTASSPNLLYIGDDLGTVAVTDNAPSSTIVIGDGSNLVYSGTANTTLIGGTGPDTVTAGAGNDTVALGTAANTVNLGRGNSLVVSQGADLINAGSGHDTIDVLGNNATINGGYGSSTLAIDDNAGANTIINVSTGATVTGASASVTTINAYGNTTVHGGAGGTLYNEQNGTLKFIGMGGNITVTGGEAAGNDTLYGASGTNVVLVSAAHDNVFVANDPAEGAGGSVTLNGAAASGGNEFWAGSGNATLIGGTGGDTLVGGYGDSTIIGGVGTSTNYFDLFAGHTSANTDLTIENFGAVASNRLTFFDFGQGAAGQALAGATETNGNTTLTLNNGATVTLLDVHRSALSLANVAST